MVTFSLNIYSVNMLKLVLESALCSVLSLNYRVHCDPDDHCDTDDLTE